MSTMTTIDDIIAREILDSRGNPTVEVDVYLKSGTASVGILITIFAGVVIGTVSFSGSIIAYGKLEEKIKDFSLPAGQFINIGLLEPAKEAHGEHAVILVP